MKTVISVMFVLAMLIGFSAQARQPNKGVIYQEAEIQILNIVLNKDGTGIIRGPSCLECNFKNFVQITPSTQAYANSVPVSIFRAAGRAGKDVYVKFYAKTGVVKEIRWSE